MDSLTIDLVEPSEVATVWDVLSCSYNPPLMRGYNFKLYIQKLAERAVTLALRIDGRPVGAVSFYANNCRDGIAYVSNIAVAAPFAGCRFGEKLLLAAAAESRSRGMETLRLEVRRTNYRALALYRRLGFVEEPGDQPSATVDMSVSLEELTTSRPCAAVRLRNDSRPKKAS